MTKKQKLKLKLKVKAKRETKQNFNRNIFDSLSNSVYVYGLEYRVNEYCVYVGTYDVYS